MKLFVRLFYILFFVFLAGIILLIAVPPTSVMSRVATGLVTGSFIGLVNALANYYHLRQAYFEQMVDALMSISQELRMDYKSPCKKCIYPRYVATRDDKVC